MLNKYRDTPIWIVNLWAYIESEFKDAEKYVKAVSGRDFRATERTIWIRPSTGRLCVELAGHFSNPLLFIHESNLPSRTILSPLEPRPDSEIIASMSVDNYHQICRLYLSQDVKLGIYHCTSGTKFNDTVEIASCPECAPNDSDWLTERSSTTQNGWTRCAALHYRFLVPTQPSPLKCRLLQGCW
ncbi:hypothetical protein B0H16DRAFT_1593762 [Mycena metata]|uniref:Uncharacterized protein n=1 Tax=Mycena metata TaxID=1033252 RepID=A0AAD7MNP0_9AGAR|nr:hypothetical protein B0H16DRAFT_1593762 [Mycena metata]